MTDLVEYAGERVELTSPTAMPRATTFLWNRRMMLQLNCRGYAVGQHLQPEPARYAHAPVLEATTFMQPEQPAYAHHPGRFVYVKDEDSGAMCSVPHEPVRRPANTFRFSAGPGDVRWEVTSLGLRLRLSVSLPVDDAVELWRLDVCNEGAATRRLSVYPYFTIGFMSWMNQSARYRPDLGGIVAESVTPYQKVEDYARIRGLRDRTFLLHDTPPEAWEAAQQAFEGEGGLHAPDGVTAERLGGGAADYETPAAVLQYRLEFEPGGQRSWRFLFGPARDDTEILALRARYLVPGAFEAAAEDYRGFLDSGAGSLQIETPDPGFDAFVNHWLGRQLHYHGTLQRLTTDPQTRNYLQDAMGMAWVAPEACSAAVLRTLGQQEASGALPDGILLHAGAQLKYINQVPHSDHCAWLPVCLEAYLDETDDSGLLEETVASVADPAARTVSERVERALQWLEGNRDERGLSYIAQGDWCDPMNMVGHQGRGVSGWLSLATVYALRSWARVLDEAGRADGDAWRRRADAIAAAVRQHLWDGDWFARGITDDGVAFGVAADDEGRLYLNPQSWAMLAGVASPEQIDRMVRAVEKQLEGPHGVAMLGPPYTKMREDVGRLTQKFPGSAENGSVYNHAAAFYVQALYAVARPERAWRLLRSMIPGPAAEDFVQRGQLPVFLPNYYRGAWREKPRTAGRSSQLVNTGTVAWFYRILVEGLFGLRGCREGLRIAPKLPSTWREARVERRVRGAPFDVRLLRVEGRRGVAVRGGGRPLDE
ncbi:MAG: NdvB protein, partial [Xanthomonadales bacterium]|nr:NdvB protein [Xanthomonadales bacterium]